MANDEYGTPLAYIERAKALMGGIDVDPASNHKAQKVVQASRYYTQEHSGLIVPSWNGRLWLNPPYSMPLIECFTSKAIIEYERGNIREGLILVNTATETGWYKNLAKRYAMAFTERRINFLLPDPPEQPHRVVTINGEAFYALERNRVAQTLFYLGTNVKRFYEVFNGLAYAPTGSIAAVLQYLERINHGRVNE